MSKYIPILIFLIYFGINLWILPHYNVNWDEPIHFSRGQTFLNFILGKKNFDHLPPMDDRNYRKDWGHELKNETTGKTIRRSIYQWFKFDFFYKNSKRGGTHPAFSDMMAAVTNYILFVKLGIAPDVISYNYYVVFVASIFVGFIFWWIKKMFGSAAAIVSTLSLALYPLFFAELHNNIKDIPQAVFFSMALIFFFEAINKRRLRYLILFSLFGGMAFATKFNFAFAGVIAGLWLGYLFIRDYRRGLRRVSSFVRKYRLFTAYLIIGTPIVIAAIWIGTSPPAWYQPQFLLSSIFYYENIGTSASSSLKLYPLYYLLFATPFIVLVWWLIGVIGGLRLKGRKKDFYVLVLFWFLVPILRVMAPNTVIYGGVRQIMEYVPAMAILAGIGAHVLFEKVRKYSAIHVGIFLTFVPIALRLIQLHPNEGIYFNPLIGGLKGAQEHNIPDWGSTLGNPYKQAINWINYNAEQDARLAYAWGQMTNLPYIWVRNDIKYSNTVKSGPARNGEYIMALANPSIYDLEFQIRELNSFVTPVQQIEVDGVPIVKIWKNEERFVSPDYLEEELVENVKTYSIENAFVITLPQIRNIKRVEFDLGERDNCEMPVRNIGQMIFITNDDNPSRKLPAIDYDFQIDQPYKEPYVLFAAERAQVLKLEFDSPLSCFSYTQSVRVYATRDLL